MSQLQRLSREENAFWIELVSHVREGGVELERAHSVWRSTRLQVQRLLMQYAVDLIATGHERYLEGVDILAAFLPSLPSDSPMRKTILLNLQHVRDEAVLLEVRRAIMNIQWAVDLADDDGKRAL